MGRLDDDIEKFCGVSKHELPCELCHGTGIWEIPMTNETEECPNLIRNRNEYKSTLLKSVELSDEELLELRGWLVACESPLEIEDNENEGAGAASGTAVESLLSYYKQDHEITSEAYKEYVNKYYEIDSGLTVFSKYTCAGCSLAKTCEFAFDGYNIDGDCLQEK